MITMHARPKQTDRQTNITAIARRFVLVNASRAKKWACWWRLRKSVTNKYTCWFFSPILFSGRKLLLPCIVVEGPARFHVDVFTTLGNNSCLSRGTVCLWFLSPFLTVLLQFVLGRFRSVFCPVLAHDAFVRTSHRAIVTMFVRLSVCLSGTPVHCDQTMHVSADVSLLVG